MTNARWKDERAKAMQAEALLVAVACDRDRYRRFITENGLTGEYLRWAAKDMGINLDAIAGDQ